MNAADMNAADRSRVRQFDRAFGEHGWVEDPDLSPLSVLGLSDDVFNDIRDPRTNTHWEHKLRAANADSRLRRILR